MLSFSCKAQNERGVGEWSTEDGIEEICGLIARRVESSLDALILSLVLVPAEGTNPSLKLSRLGKPKCGGRNQGSNSTAICGHGLEV